MLLLVLGAGCVGGATDDSTEPNEIDRSAILEQAQEDGLIMKDTERTEMVAHVAEDEGAKTALDQLLATTDFQGWQSAALADVTGGESYGLAYAQTQAGTYSLIAKMGNLPEPGEGYFYEGWIVRRGAEMSVISTGKAELIEDQYINVYQSSSDLLDHDFYVLTLEPDDGDPAPAEHILEGTLK